MGTACQIFDVPYPSFYKAYENGKLEKGKDEKNISFLALIFNLTFIGKEN